MQFLVIVNVTGSRRRRWCVRQSFYRSVSPGQPPVVWSVGPYEVCNTLVAAVDSNGDARDGDAAGVSEGMKPVDSTEQFCRCYQSNNSVGIFFITTTKNE